ncbi:twitch domain-containing radical SAM protein [Candidatus Woesearchaeota archaeon]|jgi:sulfatase maturation enzyme AslB (radical SAM superfamily)|nr:twitch domain-containing radical SAM protein [Candidatus Woesearchaeota archaeon]MBT7558343.1 twitch domain-containing radical SAM protein [Candidatus Woesearchaeota archaeon]
MLSKTFCVYPWINIHTNTDGRAKLCCNIYTEDYVQKDNKPLVLGSTEFDEFWNGDYMKSVREGMLNGEEIDACQICYDREKIGMESSRVWANENILDDELKKRIESETIHGEFSYNPTHLELRLGNKCNLKCNSCWSVSSNTIYKERTKIMESEKDIPEWLSNQWNHEIDSVNQYDWNWFNSKKFDEFIDKVAPTMKRLYLTGGEPTLINKNYDILEKLMSVGNKSVYPCWTTNLTIWPERFYDTLDYFDSSEVQMSIDGYGDQNYYTRYPTKWKLVERNFKKSLELPDKVNLKIYFVFQAWNIFNVCDLVRWVEKNSNGRNIDFVPIYLEYPTHIHSTVWPRKVLDKAVKNLLELRKTSKYKSPITGLINYLKHPKEFSVEELKKMKYFIDLNDKHRGIKFSDYFPELTDELT